MDKLSIIVISGTRERLQMAAMVASIAAVTGSAVSVLLSMNALAYFVKGAAAPAPAEGELGRLMAAKGAPEFKTLFEQAVELGEAKVYPCSMAIDVLGVQPDGLEPYLGEPMGLTKFLADAAGGQLVSF